MLRKIVGLFVAWFVYGAYEKWSGKPVDVNFFEFVVETFGTQKGQGVLIGGVLTVFVSDLISRDSTIWKFIGSLFPKRAMTIDLVRSNKLQDGGEIGFSRVCLVATIRNPKKRDDDGAHIEITAESESLKKYCEGTFQKKFLPSHDETSEVELVEFYVQDSGEKISYRVLCESRNDGGELGELCELPDDLNVRVCFRPKTRSECTERLNISRVDPANRLKIIGNPNRIQCLRCGQPRLTPDEILEIYEGGGMDAIMKHHGVKAESH